MADLPAGIRRDYPLARLTTVRTGGHAELFARPGTVAELEKLLAQAAGREIQVGVVGSGSNLLVADTGVRGLVLKLDQQLSRITVDGTRIDCGGGARLPAVSAQAARAGLSGIEFGAGCTGLRVGGAGFSDQHANFVENLGDATTADVVALMTEGRRRVRDRFAVELEPEVQALEPAELPADWTAA